MMWWLGWACSGGGGTPTTPQAIEEPVDSGTESEVDATTPTGDSRATAATSFTGDTGGDALVLTWASSAPAIGLEGTFPVGLAPSYEAVQGLHGAWALMLADLAVQDLLGGLGVTPSNPCWSRPSFPRWTFTLDYTGCAKIGATGAAVATNHANGLQTLSPDALTLEGRIVSGTLGFDLQTTHAAGHTYAAFGTSEASPSTTQLASIGVSVDGTPYDVDLDGTLDLDITNADARWWGTATVSTKPVTSWTIGGLKATDGVPLSDWDQCRCSQQGGMAASAPLTATRVVLDIDDFEVKPDLIDDPELTIDVDVTIDGTVALQSTGCGSVDTTFTTTAKTMSIDGVDVASAMAAWCAKPPKGFKERCPALVHAAQTLPNEVSVSVDPALWNAAAETWRVATLDLSGCTVP